MKTKINTEMVPKNIMAKTLPSQILGLYKKKNCTRLQKSEIPIIHIIIFSRSNFVSKLDLLKHMLLIR